MRTSPPTWFAAPAALAAASILVTGAARGATTPPAACNDIPQITDAGGDGHHANEDITAAWFSEAGGRLQAVLRVRTGVWEPAHDDSETADFAVLFTTGGATRYVRLVARRGNDLRYDHGTWTQAGGFATEGATAGSVIAGSGGTVTIDVPGVTAGTKLASPFALTADGTEGGGPHWVDKAPGGETPVGDGSFGADYVVGSCGAAPTATPGPYTVPATSA